MPARAASSRASPCQINEPYVRHGIVDAPELCADLLEGRAAYVVVAAFQACDQIAFDGGGTCCGQRLEVVAFEGFTVPGHGGDEEATGDGENGEDRRRPCQME